MVDLYGALWEGRVEAFGRSVSSLQICFAAPISFPATTGPAQPFDDDHLQRTSSGASGAIVKFPVPSVWGDPRCH